MAGNSPPRRSSRARTGQSQSHHSSTTSSLSGRPERATRSLIKAVSPPKSTPSLSDEPPDESVASTDEIPIRRRRTRAAEQEQDREKPPSPLNTIEMAPDPDEIQEEDEAVRCICGFEEYPGLPPVEEEKKQPTKDSIDVEPLLPADVNTDDLAGFYVQCDICKVWQHGACVGIMSEAASPDEYFCEECRKEFHKIHTAHNGQKYSHYLPLRGHRHSTTRSRSPRSKEDQEARATRSGRQSSLQTQKRRSTMNSRDAAYDEEEQLRRAIEASKEDTFPETGEGSTRRTKRNRSDSEEKSESAKKRKTKSRSSTPAEEDNDEEAIRDDSEEGSNSRVDAKKTRHGSARIQSSSKDKSEKDERERQRAENAKKRSGRAERRRADGGSTPASTIRAKGLESQADTDSDPLEDLPLAARIAANRTSSEKAAPAVPEPSKVEAPSAPEPPPSSQPTPDSPPTTAPAPSVARPKKPKKKGRNQYTKEREAREEASPVRSQSRDVQVGHDSGPSLHHAKAAEVAQPVKSHGRAKGGFNSKVSMTDMKRKVHAMLDYIQRTQVEMAGEVTPPNDDSRRPSDGSVGAQAAGISLSAASEKKLPDVNGAEGSSSAAELEKEFKDLTSIEMMDRLTRDLVKWQNEFRS